MSTHNICFHEENKKNVWVTTHIWSSMYILFIVLDMKESSYLFFLFLHENIFCGYSLELP